MKEILIKEITNKEEKKDIARKILEALKDWFEVDDAREGYIEGSAELPFFAAFDEDKPIGFINIKQTGDATVELAVMGVLKDNHRSGVGRKLFEVAKEYARNQGYEFMQVKTVKFGVYPEYDETNKFYKAVGFKELEVIESIWDEENPCQIYIMSLTR